MRFTKDEKDIINRVHLLSGKSYKEIEEVFESLCLCSVLAYLEKEPIDIPLFGKMSVSYKGDSITNKGKEAQLEVSVTPSPTLKRVIGQIEDEVESDLEVSLRGKIKSILKNIALQVE